jgi:hypothetical protein
MQDHRNKIVVGLALLAVVSGAVIACSTGGGPFDIVGPYDRPPDSRQKPTDNHDPAPDSRQNPGNSTQNAPSSVDNPGSQGGGPSSSGGSSSNCPPCDGTFKCVTITNGQMQSSTLLLKTVDGTCQSVDSNGASQATIACGGALIEDGANVGQWTSTGIDNLSATGMVSGATAMLTCTRSATVMPTPTSTGTVPVPDSGVSIPIEAGKL